jgi:uncharacterized protein YcbK (DUF882 family)
MSKWEYFEDSEVEGLDENFIPKLVIARKKTIELDPDHVGVAFVITSGKRTIEKNESVIGAVPDSSHLTGHAVDLRVRSSREAALIVDACMAAGINRRGIYVDSYWNTRHIHIDDDPTKVSEVLFIKEEQN